MSVCLSVCPPVRPFAWKNSAITTRIFTNDNNWSFLEYVMKSQDYYNLVRITDNLDETLSTVMIISRLFFLRNRNVSDKAVEKIEIFYVQ